MPNSCNFALFQLKLNVAAPDALPMWAIEDVTEHHHQALENGAMHAY